MKILVTGGLGFIGSHIVEHHLNKGDKVYVVDDLSTGDENNIILFGKNANFQYEIDNILTWPQIEKIVGWADLIYHMAAVVGNFRVIQEPINVIAGNIAGTERIFRAITQNGTHPRIIVASTSEVYGNTKEPIMTEDDPLVIECPSHFHSNYSISKLADEIIGLSYCQINKIPATIIRLFNTIGPRQTGSYGFVVPKFVAQACENEPITIYGDGTQTRSFCDVRDVATILDLIAENKETSSEILNVGFDREITIKNLALLIRQRANSQSELTYTPYREVYEIEFFDIMRRKPNLTKLNHFISYKHQWSLEQTIDELIKKYREKH